ncbi:pyrimidodiazepine synthase-like [Plutella xylostella]|uniref:pyrimidodiazepine synthase-like n=1 Tax=Plutella xylostella TaxID=51655 RepID=UPI00203260D3|nr:pyrimidodiazepine synthase-like [Plutella xylostella]
MKMTEKHLQTGDALPPYNGRLRLFAMRFCPYAGRCVLVLNAKNIPYDVVYINLTKKPEWIFNFSPKGAVPALEYEEGKALFDSNVINTYLDEEYPECPLQASDPLRRAQDQLVVENFNTVITAYFTAAYNPQGLQPSHPEIFHKGLELLQKELETRGTEFLHGAEAGMVDYTLWPFLERFEALPLGNAELALDKSNYKTLLTYMESMKQLPAVMSNYLPPDIYAKFTDSFVTGDPDYDILLSSDEGC